MMSILSHSHTLFSFSFSRSFQMCAPSLPSIQKGPSVNVTNYFRICWNSIPFYLCIHVVVVAFFSLSLAFCVDSSVNRNDLLTVIKPGQKPFKFILIRIHFPRNNFSFFFLSVSKYDNKSNCKNHNILLSHFAFLYFCLKKKERRKQCHEKRRLASILVWCETFPKDNARNRFFKIKFAQLHSTFTLKWQWIVRSFVRSLRLSNVWCDAMQKTVGLWNADDTNEISKWEMVLTKQKPGKMNERMNVPRWFAASSIIHTTTHRKIHAIQKRRKKENPARNRTGTPVK